MLNLLVEYAKSHYLVAEPGFTSKQVRWAINVSRDGKAATVIELGNVSAKRNPGRRFNLCPDMSQPELTGGKAERCHFLIETAQVVVLILKGDEEKKERKRIEGKHRYFVQLMRDAGQAVRELGIAAGALESDVLLSQVREEMQRQKVKPTDKVTFCVDGVFPVEDDAWHDWWRQHRMGLALKSSSSKKMQMPCFATGDLVDPSPTHPKIAGLADVGGQPNKDALICFDKESSRSYGLKQSENCAVGKYSAAAYREALQDILEKNSKKLAGTKVIYWFKETLHEEDDPLRVVLGDDSIEEISSVMERNAIQRIGKLLASITTGERPELQHNFFYAITLSGASGRVMIRDWMEGRFDQLVERVAAWFSAIQMTNLSGTNLAPLPKMERVITALLPPRKREQKYKDWVKPVGTARLALWHTAVRGDPMPRSIIDRLSVIHRNAMVSKDWIDLLWGNGEKQEPALLSLLYARMGILKTYWTRKGGTQMDGQLQPYLNEGHPHPAYHCGRLMAVLAALQKTALGDVGAGVVQRYYAAASATPGLVLGRLVRTGQFHIGKLDGGLAYWYEDKLGSIWARIKDAIPPTLSLEEQSLFALGYYQQLVDLRLKKDTENNQTEKE